MTLDASKIVLPLHGSVVGAQAREMGGAGGTPQHMSVNMKKVKSNDSLHANFKKPPLLS